MILNTVGSGLIGQDSLYTFGHPLNNPAIWGRWGEGVDPDAVRDTLNNFLQVPVKRYSPNGGGMINPSTVSIKKTFPTVSTKFATFDHVDTGANTQPAGLTHLEIATLELIDSLLKQRVPIQVSVEPKGHWVVVKGIKTASEPFQGSPDEIWGFYVNNPSPPCPCQSSPICDQSPPPHSDGDSCGSGKVYKTTPDGNAECDYGTGNEYWPMSEWEQRFKSCDLLGNGIKKFVAVYFETKQKITIRIPARARWPGFNMSLIEELPIIETSEIKMRAVNELKKHSLYDDPSYEASLKDAKPYEPILVRRLDIAGSYFYLVPMGSNKKITAIAVLDASMGGLLGFRALPNPVSRLFYSSEEVTKRISNKMVDLDGKGKIVFHEGVYMVHPEMVWKPCRESTSEYYPFYEVTIGKYHVYVGSNGRIYPTLHDTIG